MKKNYFFTAIGVAALISAVFFYKSIIGGKIPFPGDLLVSEYKPWRTTSYLGYNPGSIPNKAQYPDTLRQIYPWKSLVVDMLKKGQLPLWNPYNFSGSPLLANFQSAVFYPLNIIYFLFSMPAAWTILVFLEPFLAFCFTFFYAKKLGTSHIGALLSSASFSFSSFMTVWLEYNTVGHVILWLPLILLAVENLREKFQSKWIVVAITSLTMSLLAGHPQIFTYLFIFCFIYLLFRLHGKPWKTTSAVLFLFPIGLGAIQIFPGIELIKNAARSSHTYAALIQKILIQPWQLLMLIVPNIFGNPATRNYWLTDTYIGKVTSIGLVPLFFIPAAWRIKSTISKFYLFSALLVLLLTTVNPVTILFYKFDIPLLSASSPTLMLFLFSFCLSILAGLGLDAWRTESHRVKRLVNRTIAVLLFFILLWVAFAFAPRFFTMEQTAVNTAHHAILYESILALMVLTGFAVAITRKKYMTLVLGILLLVHLGDLFTAFHKFNPFVPQQLVFPKHEVFDYLVKNNGINRYWGYGNAAIEANFATKERVFSTDGYDPLYPRWYGEFIVASQNGDLPDKFTNATRSDAAVAPGYGELDLPSNTYRLKILDSLSVQTIVDHVDNANSVKTFPSDRFTLTYEQNGWKYYRNNSALPKAYLVTDIQTYNTKKEFASKFFDKNFDLTRSILMDHLPDFSLTKPMFQKNINIDSYQPNHIILSSLTDAPSVLILTDTYFPGWQAAIDGQKTKIYQVNYTFRGIYLPEGRHKIQFTYMPDSIKIGVAVSITSIFLFLFILLIGII